MRTRIRRVAVLLIVMLGLSWCAGLAELALPSQLRVLQSEAFMGDDITGIVVLPEQVDTLGDRVFADTDIYALDWSQRTADIEQVGSRLFGDGEIAYLRIDAAGITALADDAFAGARIIISNDGIARDYALSHGARHVYIRNLREYEGFYYDVQDGKATLLCAVNAETVPETVTLPDEVNGAALTAVSNTAFFRCPQVTRIELPGAAKQGVEDGAFSGAPDAEILYRTAFGITQQPSGVYARLNDTVTLNLKADATAFRWQYYDGQWTDVNYDGQGTDTLSFRFTQAMIDEAAGWKDSAPKLWRCVVGDDDSQTETSEAVSVLETPRFVSEPEDQLGDVGDSVTFAASLAGAFSAWRWETSNDGGETWSTLEAETGSTGDYTVRVNSQNRANLYRAAAEDALGNLYYSREAKACGWNAAFIEAQPEDQAAFVGDEVEFSVQARNATRYAWQVSADDGASWADIGENAETLSLSVEDESYYAQRYRCLASNDVSSTASVAVSIQKPGSDSMIDMTAFSWSSASIGAINDGIPVGETIVLNGASAETGWTWRTGDLIVVDDDSVTVTEADGQTSDVLEIVDSGEQLDGNAHISLTLKGKRVGRATLIGTNGENVVSCVLEVYGPKPVIVSQPTDQIGVIGDVVQLSVDAIGATAYAWKKTSGYSEVLGTDVFFDIEITSEIAKSNGSGAGWRCIVSGHDGETVDTNVVYIYQPSSCAFDEEEIVGGVGETVTINYSAVSYWGMTLEYSTDGGQTWKDFYGNSSLTHFRINSEGSNSARIGVTNDTYQRIYRCHILGLNDEHIYSSILRIIEPRDFAIVSQPEDQYAVPGETVRFEITVDGAASYQWQCCKASYANWEDETNDGATSSVLTVTAETALLDTALWRCIVTGEDGHTIVSKFVTIKSNLCIITPPKDCYVAIGDRTDIYLRAKGAESYQWQKRLLGQDDDSWEDMKLGSKVSTFGLIPNEQTIGKYEYRCVITGTNGDMITTNPIRVIEKLSLETQPTDVSVSIGGTAEFTVSAVGAQAYQWYVSKDGGMTWEASDADDAKTPSLSFTVEQAHYGWLWRCDITGDNQYAYSNVVRIDPKLGIVRQPENVEANVFDTAVFEVVAQNADGYQWQVSADGGETWSAAPGESKGAQFSYTLTDDSDYEKRWRCVVTDKNGGQLASDAVRAVEPSVMPSIFGQPESVYAADGDTVSLNVSATGVKRYQWQISYDGGATWSDVSSANADRLDINATETLWNTAQWRCALTGTGGATLYTASAKLYEPMWIKREPLDEEGKVGDVVTFTVEAPGAASYLWQESSDSGMTWTNRDDLFASGGTLDVPVEEAHFDSYRWRCVVTGPLGDQKVSAYARILRAEVPVTSISLDMHSISLLPGKTQQLHATIMPEDATDKQIFWLSDDPLIASVDDNGVVKGWAPGTTAIRAKMYGVQASCAVTVADDFSIAFPDFISETWTEDVNYNGIAMRFNGAVLPCTVDAVVYTSAGKVKITSGKVTVNTSDWVWNIGAFTAAGTYYATVTATDAAGRSVSVRTGNITVNRKPVYRALMIYQRDWKNNEESPWFRYDAEYLKNVLEQNSYEGGAKYQVSISANQTKTNIEKKIKSTFSGVKDGDVSFIWISCHGDSHTYSGTNVKYEGSLWVPAATSQSEMDKNNNASEHRILASELSKWITSYIPKGNVFIGLSSCGSGAMVYPYISESKSASAMSESLVSALINSNSAVSRTGELKKKRFNVITGASYHASGYGSRSDGTFLPGWFSKAGGFVKSDDDPTIPIKRPVMYGDYDGNGSVTISECYKYVISIDTSHNPRAYWSDPNFVVFHYDD